MKGTSTQGPGRAPPPLEKSVCWNRVTNGGRRFDFCGEAAIDRGARRRGPASDKGRRDDTILARQFPMSAVLLIPFGYEERA
jgi:hypothetical protein